MLPPGRLYRARGGVRCSRRSTCRRWLLQDRLWSSEALHRDPGALNADFAAKRLRLRTALRAPKHRRQGRRIDRPRPESLPGWLLHPGLMARHDRIRHPGDTGRLWVRPRRSATRSRRVVPSRGRPVPSASEVCASNPHRTRRRPHRDVLSSFCGETPRAAARSLTSVRTEGHPATLRNDEAVKNDRPNLPEIWENWVI
jgi:hypothetical protein